MSCFSREIGTPMTFRHLISRVKRRSNEINRFTREMDLSVQYFSADMHPADVHTNQPAFRAGNARSVPNQINFGF